jgi:hypothetical protein
MQDLNGAAYASSRYGSLDVAAMAVPHAARALAALEREHGAAVRSTRLGAALAARALSEIPSSPDTYRREPAPQSVQVSTSPGPRWRLFAVLGLALGLFRRLRR